MLTENQVINNLCLVYSIKKELIFSNKRESVQVQDARKLLCKWYKEILCIGTNDIAKKLNFKSETSVKQAIKRFDDIIDVDDTFLKRWCAISGEVPMKHRKHEKHLLHIICSAFKVNKLELKKPTHKPKISIAKQILVKWYKDIGGLSYPNIAKKMDYADHTSGIYAYNTANYAIEGDSNIKKLWYKLPQVDIYPLITSLKHRPCQKN